MALAVTMTSDVGPASEGNKESDQLGADTTKEKRKDVAVNQQNQSCDPEKESDSQPSPPANSQRSRCRLRWRKSLSVSRGIYHFITHN